MPVVITAGRPEDNQKYLTEFKLKCPVLLAEESLYQEYGANGTPVGYLIDQHGAIASSILVGGDDILKAATRRNVAVGSSNGHNAQTSIKEGTVGTRST
jgi:hypothetical protein